MNTELTDINIVLDRSGSMQAVQSDTIGGYNKFIEDQKKQPGQCTVSLVQFDDIYETVYAGVPVSGVQPLTTTTFVPRGMTALLDAIGKSINAVGERLRRIPESARPAKVMMVIMTDGGENASKEFTRSQVMEMIKHQRDKYGWDFVFLGANQDAIATAASYGIMGSKSMTYASNTAGTVSAFASMSNYTSAVRAAKTLGEVHDAAFTAEDRDAQKAAGA